MIIPAKVIRSKRRTLSLQINENGELIVRAPQYVSEIVIRELIEKNRYRIEQKKKEFLLRKSKLKVHQLIDGEGFLFLGKKYELKFVLRPLLKTDYRFVTLMNGYLLVCRGEKINSLKVIEKFYKTQARKIFEERVNFYLKILNNICNSNYSYRRIKLSSGRVNIGSCTTKGDLNFSWRLIQAPLEIIDYVIIHELAHFKEKHHKKSFWLIVKKLMPNFVENARWLKENWFYLRDFLRNTNIN